MARKMYDIMPPKVAHQLEEAIKSLSISGAKKQTHRKGSADWGKGKHKVKGMALPVREIAIGGGVAILLLGMYFYNVLPSVQVRIYPTLNYIVLSEKVTADATADAIDFSRKIIPARYLEAIKQGSQEFPATGTAESGAKAAGTIRIYNKISPSSPLSLKAGTHFLSDSGKYFVTLEKITVPGMQGKNSGSIEAKVQAKEAGPGHNIGPAKFSIPKLSGTPYYYSIWAESKNAMAGGYSGTVKKITEDDIHNAEQALSEKLLQEAEAELRAKLAEGEMLAEGALAKSIESAVTNAKAGQVANTFQATADVKVSALLFSQQDLEKLAEHDAANQLSDGKVILDKSIALDYRVDSIDRKAGSGRISVSVSAESYHDIGQNDLSSFLAGKSADEMRSFIRGQYGDKVSSVKVSFWPFWVRKAPADEDKISVALDFE